MKENFVQLWVIYFKSWWKKTLYNSGLFTLNLDERKLCTTLSYFLLILMKENFVQLLSYLLLILMKENLVQLWVIYFKSWWKKTLYNSELFTFNFDERKLGTTLSYLL